MFFFYFCRLYGLGFWLGLWNLVVVGCIDFVWKLEYSLEERKFVLGEGNYEGSVLGFGIGFVLRWVCGLVLRVMGECLGDYCILVLLFLYV